MADSKTIQNRRVERIALPLPVKIEAKDDTNNPWSEITRFKNISPCGAAFEIKTQIKVGQLLLLSAPVPQKLRCYDYSEQQYRIWGIVRYIVPNLDNPEIANVGVAFIGKNPPSSYYENPAKLYDLLKTNSNGLYELTENRGTTTQTEEKKVTERKNQRHPIPLEIFLEALDQDHKPIAYETTVSENVSICGAAVFTTLDVQVGQTVRVNCFSYNISILATVRNRRLGNDGMPRLHLQFIDRELPLEGIQ